MSAPRAGHSSRSMSFRACTNCQKRKSRCVRSAVTRDGACTYCTRARKSCSFETPPSRTPLTRRNLDASEARCAQLVALLRSLHPDLDIEASLAQVPRSLPEHPGLHEEADPAHEYEWHEPSLTADESSPTQTDGLGDGMATLATSDAGYLGSSSGSKLLEEITVIISHFPYSPEGERTAQRSGYGVPASTPSTPFDPPDLVISAVTVQLIDAYFLFYNRWYPILSEAAFRQKAFFSKPGPAKTPWRVIYYMVLAIGHWTCTTDSDHMQSGYYAAARSSLSINMLEAGTIETLQAFLLMGNYLQKRDRPNTGYNLIGVAYRMALGQGLHRQSSEISDSAGLEQRRRLFWTLYCFDTGFNITTGRPPSISEHCFDTEIPRNVDEKNLSLPLPHSIAVVEHPTTVSCIIAHSQLAKVANHFYGEFLLAKSAGRKIEYQVAESIDRQLMAWETDLPAYFTSVTAPAWFLGPRAALFWKQQNLRIILWRGSDRHHPFLPSKPGAERRCLDIAMRSASDIWSFCVADGSSLHQGITWYATYFLFQATLVLEESFLTIPNHEALSDDIGARELCIIKARECLGILSLRNRSAIRCLEIIDRLHNHLAQLNPAQDMQTDLRQNNHGLATASDQIGPSEDRHPGDLLQEQGTVFPDQSLPLFENPGDDNSDPTLRMLINQTALEYLDDSAMDMLLEGWEEG